MEWIEGGYKKERVKSIVNPTLNPNASFTLYHMCGGTQ